MMAHMKVRPKHSPGRELYERDEHEWTAAQISARASGQIEPASTRENLIEFLTETAIRDRRELRSKLSVLLHLLKNSRFQPERLSASWVEHDPGPAERDRIAV